MKVDISPKLDTGLCLTEKGERKIEIKGEEIFRPNSAIADRLDSVSRKDILLCVIDYK